MINRIIQGDTLEKLKELPDESVDCIITSPPYYGLRDYGVEGQLGLEKTLDEYLIKMLLITAELKRVLKKTGTMWWNHGDSYMSKTYQDRNGLSTGIATCSAKRDGFSRVDRKNETNLPEKSLLLQAHRLVIRMIDEQGWILRNTIIWHKPNCMPSSVKDRFTVDYEPVFFFSKSKKYWFETQYEAHTSADLRPPGVVRNRDLGYQGKYKTTSEEWKTEANKGLRYGGDISKNYSKECPGNPLGRNKRCVWKIPTAPFKEAHFATFPEKLIEPMVKAGCPVDGIVLDPFFGAGTTGVVAKKNGRNWLGIELNPEYIKIATKRISEIPERLL